MNQYVTLLMLLLENSIIANFEYWSEFIIRIQRDEATRHPTLQEMFGKQRIPSLFCLRLRSTWRFDDPQQWEAHLQHFPMRGVAPIAFEAPLQAAILMTTLGNTILQVKVNENGDLTMSLSGGRSMTVQGTGGQWEESWFLELPVDDPDRDRWSIICDSQGLIGGKFPTPRRV